MFPMDYTLLRSDRKSIAIRIKPDGQVEVRCPKRMSRAAVQAFVDSKKSWIAAHLAKLTPVQRLTDKEREALREETRRRVTERAAYFAPLVGVTYGRIAIRAQQTRWGSCSGKGNLNFNCLLALAPDEVLDYVVVHELCHRREMNHSPRFWQAVEQILPNYKVCRAWLKAHGRELIAKL